MISTLTVFLSSCGFQLRQETVLLDSLSPMVWQAEVPDSEFQTSFAQVLADYQVSLTARPADVLFTLHAFEVKEQLIGKVSTLDVTAVWSLTNQWGYRVIYRRITNAQVSGNNVERDEQQAALVEQLYQALGQKIVAQLSQVQADQLDQKPVAPMQ
jgi:outer membrane lipopolysaccharide assembly protein LptE/RlpB